MEHSGGICGYSTFSSFVNYVARNDLLRNRTREVLVAK
jgi:hypothetical protein